MTREEKINTLKAVIQECEEYQWQRRETLFEIIKDLEQQPCEDAISRQAVLDLVNSDWKYEGLETDVASLPPVTPKQIECEDAISRADAVKVASGYCHPSNVAKELAKLPPVTPKKRWIPVSERLPENFQRVLITIVNYNGDKVVRVAEFHIHSWNKIFQVKENYEQWEVGEKGLLAWKPLPEPYEPQESENKE